MLKKIVTAIASAAVVAGVLLAGPANAAGVPIAGKGSSFANGMLQACAAAYSTNDATYTSTGSGTGRTEFAAGRMDFGMTDGTYTSGFPSSAYVTVPLLGGPVAFAYSAVGVQDGLQLTPQIISAILKGTVTRWDDESIKALNTRIKLPKKAIKVAYRASGSGTNSNLTNYLSQNVGGWTKSSNDMVAAAGGSGSFASNSTSFANSQLLAAYIEDNSNAFGYFDLSDAITADVGIAKLKNAAGAFVAPTASAAGRFISAQTPVTGGTDATDGTLSIDFTKVVSGAYQLSIVTYGVAPKWVAPSATPKAMSTDAKKLAVRNFFDYIVKTCVPSKAASLGYVAIGGALKMSALNQIKTIG
jgi:phosphate transport system substrate-binding protein